MARAHELHPDEAILLDGVDEDEYLNAVRDKAFVLIGASSMYLAPGQRNRAD